MPKSQEEHVEQGGTQCPFCNSEQLEGLPIDVVNGRALQEIYCVDCQASWTDIYTLTSYTIIEEPEEPTNV